MKFKELIILILLPVSLQPSNVTFKNNTATPLSIEFMLLGDTGEEMETEEAPTPTNILLRPYSAATTSHIKAGEFGVVLLNANTGELKGGGSFTAKDNFNLTIEIKDVIQFNTTYE